MVRDRVSSHASSGARLRFRTLFDAGIAPVSVVLAIIVMLTILVLSGLGYRWLAESEAPLSGYLIHGQTLLLSAEDGQALSRNLSERLAGLEASTEKRLQPWVDRELVMVRERYLDAGRRYLDWYFSAVGSYTRLGVTVVGDLESWTVAQLEERLVEPSGVEEALSNLGIEYRERLLEVEQALLAEALDDIYQRYSPAAVPALEAEGTAVVTLNLDRVMAAADPAEGREAVGWSEPPLGAGLLGGAGVTFALMARPAMTSARGLVRGFVARLGGMATRSVAAGGTAASVAAVTGPGAVVAGAAAMGATIALTAGTEYVALVTQEKELRPTMEQALMDTWTTLEAELRGGMAADRQASIDVTLARLGRASAQEIEGAGLPDTYRILSHLQ